MQSPTRYVVITPVRDEEPHVGRTIQSMVAQAIRPQAWVIVNDGSTDRTGEIIDQAAAEHPWIRALHRPKRMERRAGGGVIEAFYDGYAALPSGEWDFLVKLDGDLEFEANYFSQCFEIFAKEARLGIGGGKVCTLENGTLYDDGDGDPQFHVRGATKIYRRACWQDIGELIRAPGWDTLDEVKANMRGWNTHRFNDLVLTQLKGTGAADGTWKNWFKNGRANYIAGYHPLFMILKCAKRIFSKPYVVGAAGLWAGYVSGYLNGVPMIGDPDLIRYLRDQQVRRLMLKESIWR